MRTEQLRALLLEFLSEWSAPNTPDTLTYRSCITGVTKLAEKRCPDELQRQARASQETYDLHEEDQSRLKHVIWDLILERVLIPGTRSPKTLNDGWPCLSLTDHGRKVVAERGPVPYDPDGYLDRLKKSVGDLHPSVMQYLAESLSTFRTGNYLASVVMLGAASEMIFLELCETISKASADTSEGEKSGRQTGLGEKTVMMAKRVGAVIKWLSHNKARLPSEWQRQEQIGLIEKLADLIRRRRNDAGHPQDPPAMMTHEEMYALLVVFPDYCRRLYELKRCLAGLPKG